MTENVTDTSKKEKLKTKGSDTSKSKLNGSKISMQKKEIGGQALHLMAFADVTNLLYPGGNTDSFI